MLGTVLLAWALAITSIESLLMATTIFLSHRYLLEFGDDYPADAIEVVGKVVGAGEGGKGHASFTRLIRMAEPELPLVLLALVGLLVGSASSLAMPAFFGRVMESLLNPDHGTD